MEFHQGRIAGVAPVHATARDLFDAALTYARAEHTASLAHYTSITHEQFRTADNAEEWFWQDYVWTVYASGFRASIITKKFPSLLFGYSKLCCACGSDDCFRLPRGADHEHKLDELRRHAAWLEIQGAIANYKKFDNVLKCRDLMYRLGWSRFFDEYLKSVDTIGRLPFIGSITKYHLARNLGFDAVKPDVHLTRMAERYGFLDARSLCVYLATIYDMRVGVVDFVLWAYAAAYGTTQLR